MNKDTKTFFKAVGHIAKDVMVEGMAQTLSVPSRAVSAVKGALADVKRGNLLWKQGYGKYYDSPLGIAKRGKGGPKMIQTAVRGSK